MPKVLKDERKTSSITGTRYYCYQQRDKLLASGFQCERLQQLAKNQNWYVLTFHWDDDSVG